MASGPQDSLKKTYFDECFNLVMLSEKSNVVQGQ